MRKSIYYKNKIFIKCYDRISSLISEGVKVENLLSIPEGEYSPNEIKSIIKDHGSVKYFNKVDRIRIVYRILSMIVFSQFVVNFLLIVFFANIAKMSQPVAE